MIDLHSHVLPALDDGTKSHAEAVELAARAAADGVRTIAATPHLRADHPNVRPAELARAVDELRASLREAEVDIEIAVGGEVDILWARRASRDELVLASYGQQGSDLLVETPYSFLSPVFERLLEDVRELGFRVLLAHPERNPSFQADPERLAALVRSGVLVQVGADVLAAAPRRSRSRRLALWLMERGLAHVIASDAHGPHVARGPELSPAVAAAERVAGPRGVWMVTDAPAAILSGEPLPAAPQRARRLVLGLF